MLKLSPSDIKSKALLHLPVSLSIIFLTLAIFLSAAALIPLFSFSVLAEDMLHSDSRNSIIADISEEVAESVVLISTERDVTLAEKHPFHDDPIFRFFFPEYYREEGRSEVRRGSGTGFIVTEDGYIVTNQHVIADSDRIFITRLGEDESQSAEVIWADYSLDLAVLKIEEDVNLNPIRLGNSDTIRQGDWVIAVGNPYGFDHTVTVGVIGALERPIEIPTSPGKSRQYSNLIQTDAAINPGNSGGPLLNIAGEVIGINTAVATRAQGIGFAIPINEVKFALEEIEKHGQVTLPWLGVYYQEVTPEIKNPLNLDSTDGVIVMDVIADSPAERAGLKAYDVIREVNRSRITSGAEFAEKIRNTEPGEQIMLRIIRDGMAQLIFTTIEQRPAEY